MASQHRPLVNHTFHGGRFADHGVDIDVLPDLIRYKDIIVAVAKELWRHGHPDRKRLPQYIDDAFAIRFYGIECNCATIPLERPVTDPQGQFFVGDELDDAVRLVNSAIRAAANDGVLPEKFPKAVLKEFADYGKTLREDEWIEHRIANAPGVRYDRTIGSKLSSYADGTYTSHVDVIGSVTMARVSKPRMGIETNDGREIEAVFRPEDEKLIVSALLDHTTAKLHVIGKGQYSVDGELLRITETESVQLLVAGEIPFDTNARPIWEEFEAILSAVPPEELAKLPTDGAARHDHYIYGTGKS